MPFINAVKNLKIFTVQCGAAKTIADTVKMIQDDLIKRRVIRIGIICPVKVSKIGASVIAEIKSIRGFVCEYPS